MGGLVELVVLADISAVVVEVLVVVDMGRPVIVVVSLWLAVQMLFLDLERFLKSWLLILVDCLKWLSLWLTFQLWLFLD